MTYIKFADHGQLRELNATDGEIALFETILDVIASAGQDVSEIQAVRKSKDYISAVLGASDIARFKFNDRAKWIQLPYGQDRGKRYIESTDDVRAFSDMILAHYYLSLANNLLGYE